MKRLLIFLETAVAVILSLAACKGRGDPEDPDRFGHVVILYSAGKNNLSGSLQRNIQDFKEGFVPYKGSDKACIIVTHSSPSSRSFEENTTPYIIRMYRSRCSETVVLDTLKTLPEETMLTRASDMNSILSYIRNNFNSDSYGMVFSSHGTGWLPKGYYGNPSKYDGAIFRTAPVMASSPFRTQDRPVTYDAASIPEAPLVKSIGQEYTQEGSVITSYEMNMGEFASAIPFKMEYIIFDACLMGGIEFAYELKDKCHYIGFSPAEILTEGFDYNNMGSRLMEMAVPDPERVCQDFFNKYKDNQGSQCTAMVSLIDCDGLQDLGIVCKELIANHKDGIASLNPKEVQQFSRNEYLWFFDLRDILVKAGCSESELSDLDNALDRCVLYKASTKRILNLFDIKTFCGLSMFIPRSGSNYLNEFYKTLAWNEATGLVN